MTSRHAAHTTLLSEDPSSTVLARTSPARARESGPGLDAPLLRARTRSSSSLPMVLDLVRVLAARRWKLSLNIDQLCY